MAKITIEGSPEEIARVLKRIGRQVFGDDAHSIEQAEEQTVDKVDDEEDLNKNLLTPIEVQQLLNQITPDARKILEELAKNPESYSFADLQQVMHMEGTEIAGTLSSVGHKMRRFKGKAKPVIRDYRMREYHMAPEIAEVIRGLDQSQ